jgi:hypothetical protein
MKKVILGISLTITSLASMAQINVFSGNNVGIGAGLTSSASTLGINNIGVNFSAVTISPLSTMTRGLLVHMNPPGATCTAIGASISHAYSGTSAALRAVWGYAYTPTVITGGYTFGVCGTAGNCTNGNNYGIWGNLLGTQTGVAIYGQVGTIQGNVDAQYAGYFVGNVKVMGTIWASGTITSSDQKLKKNIAVLDSSDRIFDLKPKKYNLKTRSELIASKAITVAASDTGTVAQTAIDEPTEVTKKQHFGFLAQDIQKVYPDLVYTSGDGTLGVDYQGLIPIIIAQLQIMKQSQNQMQQQIDAKDARIVALEDAVAKLKGKK